MGDMNIDLLKYNDDIKIGNFYDKITSFTFEPLILQPTRLTNKSKTLIDNIFYNSLDYKTTSGNITTSISDHLMQFTHIAKFRNRPPKNNKKIYKRNYKFFNNSEFLEELFQVNWTEILNNLSSEQALYIFLDKLEDILNVMAPLKLLSKKEVKLLNHPWLTQGILISIKSRDILHKNFISEKNDVKRQLLHNLYKNHRNLLLSLERTSKKLYYAEYFKKNSSNIKKTWEGINQIIKSKKRSNGSPKSLIIENKFIFSEESVAHEMNKYFSNIGENLSKSIPDYNNYFKNYLQNSMLNSVFLEPCTVSEIATIIEHLDAKKSVGPCSFPTNLIKQNKEQFAFILNIIINKSLEEGKFPSKLKYASVCPIYKKGNPENCCNYRPISLLSNISKIFEKIMYSRLYNFI